MKLFKKKKKVEIPELNECMDALGELSDCLKRSRDIEDYDELVDANLLILSAKIEAWQEVAKLHLVRYKHYVANSRFGKIKIRED